MAASMYGNIRLDTDLTGQLPTNTYESRATEGGNQHVAYAAVVSERSLTGVLQVHRTESAGSVMQFKDWQYDVQGTRAELALLEADLGKICYFMPHYRDEADTATYRHVVLFKSMTPLLPHDPMEQYWHSTIHLENAEGLTVD